MTPLAITDYTLCTALGCGVDANWQALAAGRTGLTPCRFDNIRDLPTYTGEVVGLDDIQIPRELASYDCRNNRLTWLSLQQDGFIEATQQAIARYGSERVAVFVGTSTSGIHQTELAYREMTNPHSAAPTLPEWYSYEGTQNTYSVAEFTRRALQLEGIAVAISTACSSSAKVFASAQRAIALNLCDAAVVGGVDSLCLTTLYGFHSLQLLAPDICRPCDKHRAGLSIGEAGGFALLQREAIDDYSMQLLGYGESSDAYHMSSPHPEGRGAAQAMRYALDCASLTPEAVSFINMHGTGTPTNDLVEANAIAQHFPRGLPCSSTKGYTGHTLGAAGIVEAIFSLLSIEHGCLPASINIRELDPEIDVEVLLAPQEKRVHRVLSNSFGFGGSNCSLLLGDMS